jgi:hypothetical protein
MIEANTDPKTQESPDLAPRKAIGRAANSIARRL